MTLRTASGNAKNGMTRSQTRSTYAEIMQEIKARLQIYGQAVRDDYKLPYLITEEFCYLQIPCCGGYSEKFAIASE
jgi:hypothetical protein